MQKKIHVFKSMQEQEEYHKKIMLQSTVADRFRRLLMMQEMTRLFHPVSDKARKIQIRKWIS
jgi:hypothetical protein